MDALSRAFAEILTGGGGWAAIMEFYRREVEDKVAPAIKPEADKKTVPLKPPQPSSVFIANGGARIFPGADGVFAVPEADAKGLLIAGWQPAEPET